MVTMGGARIRRKLIVTQSVCDAVMGNCSRPTSALYTAEQTWVYEDSFDLLVRWRPLDAYATARSPAVPAITLLPITALLNPF